jgi:citrate synthase
MIPFWRQQRLTVTEQLLLDEVLAAHDRSARRNNVSSQAVGIGAIAANDYGKAVASGILTLGGVHGPIAAAMRVLSSESASLVVDGLLNAGRLVPGWGNSFHKGVPDPEWTAVDELIAPTHWGMKLHAATLQLRNRGKNLYPNPAGYTAAAALALGIPAAIAPFLFIFGRLAAWSEIYLNNQPKDLWEQ